MCCGSTGSSEGVGVADGGGGGKVMGAGTVGSGGVRTVEVLIITKVE